MWPIKGGEAGEGTSGLVAAVKAGDGTIGYADESQAGDLGVAALKVGSAYTTPSAEGAAKVLAESPPHARAATRSTWPIDVDRTTTEAGAYPLMLTSYLIACQTYDDARPTPPGQGLPVLRRLGRGPAGRRRSRPAPPRWTRSSQQEAASIVAKISAK